MHAIWQPVAALEDEGRATEESLRQIVITHMMIVFDLYDRSCSVVDSRSPQHSQSIDAFGSWYNLFAGRQQHRFLAAYYNHFFGFRWVDFQGVGRPGLNVVKFFGGAMCESSINR